MNHSMTTIAIFISALLGAQSSTQPASTQPTTQPAPAGDVLAGPKVKDTSSAAPTIVRRAFDGTLEELEAEPGVVAAGMLDLTQEQRSAYEQLLAERLAAFDQAVRENYGLIVEVAATAGEADTDRWIDVLNKLRAGFASFLERGQFADQISPHLTEPQREQLNQMINEYVQAQVEQLQRMHGLNRQQAARRMMLETFGQMIRRSIERQVGLEREQFERLAEELGLTEEQKNKTQAIFGPLAVKKLQNQPVTPAERAAAFGRFNQLLTPEQRRKALAIIVESWKPQEAATRPATQPH
jgi:hypothetical protein